MSNLTKQQNRTIAVLQTMIEQCKANEEYAIIYADTLDPMLDDLKGADCFGTEGQDDPRGDWRDHDALISMWNVQGIDWHGE